MSACGYLMITVCAVPSSRPFQADAGRCAGEPDRSDVHLSVVATLRVLVRGRWPPPQRLRPHKHKRPLIAVEKNHEDRWLQPTCTSKRVLVGTGE